MSLRLTPDIEAEWDFWRVAMHERTRATPHEIEEYWSFDDLDIHNRLLSAIEEAQARAAQKQAQSP